MKHREKDIIEKAVKKFEKETALRAELNYYAKDRQDGILKIMVDGNTLEFNAGIKIFLNRARLGLVLNQLKAIRGIPLLITEYVNPQLMETIEKNGINFIDAAGNAYIKVPPLFIKIKGNKIDEAKKIGAEKKIFNAAALQTIFAILCNPGMERNPIREIAEYADVAVGTVHGLLKQLGRQGFLLNRNKANVMVNKEDLLERWVTLYPEKLKPKFLVGRYEIKTELIKDLNLEKYNALWGGEEAAARLTNYLRPFIYTIYIGERQGEFILRNRLRKNPQGNLVLMKKFWKFANFDYQDITHPILVYADLLATGDPRNIETAKIIYEKEIIRYIKED
jgi:hypothetical protein